MIKAVLFDYGGVISAGGKGGELGERLGTSLGVSPDQAWRYIEPVWDAYLCGDIREDELWRSVEEASGQKVSSSARKIWNTWEHARSLPIMVKFVEQLKRDGLRIGLVSNVIPNTMAAIRAHRAYELFNFAILSCEVHVAKPDKAIYELALKQLDNIKPSEVIFVDDRKYNLPTAENLGMFTVLAKSPEQVIRDVNKIIKANLL